MISFLWHLLYLCVHCWITVRLSGTQAIIVTLIKLNPSNVDLLRKNIGTLSSLTYPERLDVLHAESLELRRLKCDLTMMFRIIHGYCALDRSSFLHCITLVR